MTNSITHTLAEVTYSTNESFDIDSPPRKSSPSNTWKVGEVGEGIGMRTSYDQTNEEIYDPKKKKVKKGKSSRSVTRWLRNHHPFKCCFGTSDNSSKFEFDEAKTQTYDI